MNPKKQIKNKRYSNSGTLRILHCHADRQFSLVDYVRGNCVIRMVCAIDFTISNGQPLTQDSLHTMEEEKVSITVLNYTPKATTVTKLLDLMGWIQGPGVISGLSLLVLYSAPRGFSQGAPVFPSPQS